MTRRWLQVLTMAALAAGAGACSDRPATITAPPSASQPRAAYVDGYETVLGVDGKQWLVLTGNGKAVETRSAVIDRRGGEINLSGTTLNVPRDAVDGPTTFTMTVFTQPYIKVQLRAIAVSRGGRGGSDQTQEIHTFNGKSLTLQLSYTCAKKDLPSPALLRMLYIENDRVREVLKPSTVEIDRKNIIVQLWHFSEYSPGWDAADAAPAGDL